MIKHKLLIIFVIAVSVILYQFYKKRSSMSELFTDKPIIWMYWENVDGKKKPSYLDLCYMSIIKHCSKDFKIILLDEKSYKKYLPNIRKDIDNLEIALKVDYIRLHLLHVYGGLWLDQDLIVLKSLKTFTDKLKEYDFVGFGCTGHKCNNGYMKPSNSIMAGRKNSVLLKRCIEMSDEILDKSKQKGSYKFNYFDLGKIVIWKALAELKRSSNYKYYHFDSSYTGNRDKNLRWITAERHVSNKPVEFIDDDKLHLVLLYNSNLKFEKNKWFLALDANQVLSSDTFIGKMLRQSLI
jgi:hypothetical protein